MKRLMAMLAAAILPFCSIGASYTNSFVRNGATYVQRGALTIKDFVITNITSSGTSITTNDVLLLILSSTNSLVAALTDEDNPLIVQESRTSASSSVSTYSSSSETAYGLGTEEGTPARRSTQDVFGKLDSATTTNDVCNIVTNEVNVWSEWVRSPQESTASEIIFYNGRWILADIIDSVVYPLDVSNINTTDENATSLYFGAYEISATRTRTTRNALGVAGQSGAVNEVLLIGTDGKMYHLRIGSGGSIEVYMEAN